MNNPHGAPRAAAPWKARALHHDAERFLRAPGCQGCIDRDLCGGLNTADPPPGLHGALLRQARQLHLGVPPQPAVQEPDAGDRRPLAGQYPPHRPRPPVAPLPPVVPLIYHGYRRATPLDIPAAAIKLAQLFDRRTGAPRFTSREELCRRFALSPSAALLVSGVDEDPVIERWWGIGQPQRLAVIEAMKAIGVALVTSPNFSLCVDWPRTATWPP